MDNLNDWLYIVLLVIAGVSSLLSSKKKKKSPDEVLGQPDGDVVVQHEDVPQKGFWEILEEMQKEKPQPVVQPVAISKKKTKKQKAIEPTPFLTGEGRTAWSGTVGNIESAPPMIEESAPHEFKFDSADDLRKAIIYAEILNRKY